MESPKVAKQGREQRHDTLHPPYHYSNHDMWCALVSALRGNTVLTELRLQRCNIDAEGMSNLAEALYDIKTLSVLDVSENTIDSRGAEHLGKLSCGVWGYGLT